MPRPASDVEDFVHRWWALTRWIAARRLHQAGARGDAADIESDAYYGLLLAARSWRADGGSKPASWVRFKVEAAITDGLRTRFGAQRQNSARFRASHVPLDDVLESDLVHHDDVERSTAGVDIATAMRQLTPRQRAAVEAYYFRDRTIAEVGASFGLGESRTSIILKNAREQLRAALEGLTDPAPHHRVVRWWGAFVRAGPRLTTRSVIVYPRIVTHMRLR